MQSLFRSKGAAFGAFAVAALLPSLALAAGLQPHRAIYEIELDGTQVSSNISGLTGRLLIEWTGNACSGYRLQQRLMMELSTADGGQTVQDLRFKSWEGPDGKEFEFDTHILVNGQQVERIFGISSKEGQAPKVIFTEPAGAPPLRLPDDVNFPTHFLLSLIEAAGEGEKTFSNPVYEGSDVETHFLASAVITQSAEDDTALKNAQMTGAAHEDMQERTWWSVQLAYHRPDNRDGLPEYQVGYHLYENGVSSALKMDYNDFKVAGELTQLDYLPSEPCAP